MCSLDTAVSVVVATRPRLNPWVDRNEQLFLQTMSGSRNYLCRSVNITSVGQSELYLWGNLYYLCGPSIISVGQSVLSLWGSQYYLFGTIPIISVGQSLLSLCNNPYYLCATIPIISVGQSALSLHLCGAISIISVGNQYYLCGAI